jgi:hypothetical protein
LAVVTLRAVLHRYNEMSVITDFYDIGDSRVTFAKILSREVSKE